jgi:hypothetical protein
MKYKYRTQRTQKLRRRRKKVIERVLFFMLQGCKSLKNFSTSMVSFFSASSA